MSLPSQHFRLPQVRLAVAAGARPRATRSRLIATSFYWSFSLENAAGQMLLEVTDDDDTPNDLPAASRGEHPSGDREDLRAERLELLALVRGLEALDQPSLVTLVTASRYVSHGVRYGLELWREHDWLWEHDGVWEPIRNRDLWLRVNQALQFHQVDCRIWRVDEGWYQRHPELRAAGPRSVRWRRLPSLTSQLASLPSTADNAAGEQLSEMPLDNLTADDGMGTPSSVPQFFSEGTSCERP